MGARAWVARPAAITNGIGQAQRRWRSEKWINRQRYAPERHARPRVERQCPTKRTRGFLVIESENECESLVEKSLCLRTLRRDGVVMFNQAWHQRWLC